MVQIWLSSAYSLRRWPGKHWKPNPSSLVNMSSLGVGVKLCWLSRMRFRWESCKGDYALSRITGSHFSFQFLQVSLSAVRLWLLCSLFCLPYNSLNCSARKMRGWHGTGRKTVAPFVGSHRRFWGHAQLNIANQVSWELVTGHVKKWRCHVHLTDEHQCVL